MRKFIVGCLLLLLVLLGYQQYRLSRTAQGTRQRQSALHFALANADRDPF